MTALISVLEAVAANKTRVIPIFKKAWIKPHAFFVCLVGFSNIAQALDDCRISQQALAKLTPVKIEHIVDGDSLVLSPRQPLRLIGINTPELAESQPLARKAKRRLQQLLVSQPLRLQLGLQIKDKYKRTLGHLFLADGRNIEAIMLGEGLGFLVVIPPNTALAQCHYEAQLSAKSAKLGVWSQLQYKPVDALKLSDQNSGFQRIRGKILALEKTRDYWWLSMQGDIVLRISKADQAYFDEKKLVDLMGQYIEVSGWVIDRQSMKNKPSKFARFMLLLTHPYHLSTPTN